MSMENIFAEKIAAKSTKSLGTLPVIYAEDELQNPLPRTTMLFEGDRNSTGGRNGVLPNSQELRLSIQHCMKGEGGSQMSFPRRK